ncbi:MAG TPA: hypothetical protein VFW46_15365 [Stellaceae bacterium]|nr:hypothetical protein [Stellaceae bacterium]
MIEIETGIAKLDRTGATRRAEILRNWHGQILGSYTERVLPLDLTAARIAGSLGDGAIATGRYPGFADVAIAAIAKSQDLAVLTLNLRHSSRWESRHPIPSPRIDRAGTTAFFAVLYSVPHFRGTETCRVRFTGFESSTSRKTSPGRWRR